MKKKLIISALLCGLLIGFHFYLKAKRIEAIDRERSMIEQEYQIELRKIKNRLN